MVNGFACPLIMSEDSERLILRLEVGRTKLRVVSLSRKSTLSMYKIQSVIHIVIEIS